LNLLFFATEIKMDFIVLLILVVINITEYI